MINSKRLVSMARKWQKKAATGRRRIFTATTADADPRGKPVAVKGHFVVYTVDGRRFMVPLQHLKSTVFLELFKMSADTFGIASNGPITLPCDGVFMEHVISLVQQKSESTKIEKDLVQQWAYHLAIANQRCSIESSAFHRRHYQQINRQIHVHGF